MKKNVKRLFYLTIFFVLCISTICFANNEGAAEVIGGIGRNILNAVLWLGYAISLGMVVFIGIKYVLGSADSKANMKSAIVSWLIGALLVFGCTGVVQMVLTAANIGTGENLATEIIDAAN